MLKMIFIFFKIGFISFGGGWTTVGLIKENIVGAGYLTPEKFSEALSVAQMTPGPVAVNMATYVGYNNYGFWGAVLNTVFLLMPPIILSILVSYLAKIIKLDKKSLLSSLKIGTSVLILLTLYSLFKPVITDFNIFYPVLAVISFLLLRKTKLDPIFIILGSGALGIILF
ncbi:MAG: chromate transporter [Thermotogae bacterium]|nr:chromate transporter [Thermotogota bacterium]